MDKLSVKQKIIDECIKYHEAVAKSAYNVMNEAGESADDYGHPEDWADTFKTDMLNKKDIYTAQYRKALEEITKLKQIDAKKKMEKVNFGAVVITDNQKLFISSGIGKIIVDKCEYFAISPSVPIYAAIMNLKKGSFFEFRGKKDKIKEVF